MVYNFFPIFLFVSGSPASTVSVKLEEEEEEEERAPPTTTMAATRPDSSAGREQEKIWTSVL